MKFEVINPHDPYSMESPDFVTALAAIAILGEGKYGVRGHGFTAPPALFGDWPKEVYQAAGIAGCEELFELGRGRLEIDRAFNEAVAAALDSIKLERESITSTVDLARLGKANAAALRGKRMFAGIKA